MNHPRNHTNMDHRQEIIAAGGVDCRIHFLEYDNNSNNIESIRLTHNYRPEPEQKKNHFYQPHRKQPNKNIRKIPNNKQILQSIMAHQDRVNDMMPIRIRYLQQVVMVPSKEKDGGSCCCNPQPVVEIN
jgi:hypothetical protein